MKDKGLILLLSIPIVMSLFFLSTYLCMQLKLKGKETIVVEYKEPFHDPGVRATIMGKKAKVIVHGKVNTNQIGTYELVYELKNRIHDLPNVKNSVQDKTIVKEIVVPGRIVNIIVK